MRRFLVLLTVSWLGTTGTAIAQCGWTLHPGAVCDEHWRPPVSTTLDLPADGNLVGDVRWVILEGVIKGWDGSAWLDLSGTGGGPGGPGSSVSSVFGRTGTILPLAGDYTCDQVTGCVPTAISQAAVDTHAGRSDAHHVAPTLATETTAGIVELAADGESIAGLAVQASDTRLLAGGGSSHITDDGDSPVVEPGPTGSFVIRQPGGTPGVDEAEVLHDGELLRIVNRDSSALARVSVEANRGLEVLDGGTVAWKIDATGGITRGADDGPGLRYLVPSAVQPSVLPNVVDTNTGLGWCGHDCFSLVVGFAEGVRIVEDGTNVITMVRALANQVAPPLVVEGGVQLTPPGALPACDAGNLGTIEYKTAADTFCGCTGAGWVVLGGAGSC